MSNKAPVKNPDDVEPQPIDPQPIAEAKAEMRSDPQSMEKQHPESPLALVMGAYPLVLIVLLIAIAAFFVMSRRGTVTVDPGPPPATEVPVESGVPDPNP